MPGLQDLMDQYPDALEPIRQAIQSQFIYNQNQGPVSPFSLAEIDHPANRPEQIPMRGDLDKFQGGMSDAAGQEEKIRKLKGLRDMIESLRGFKAVTAGDVMYGSGGPAPPFEAETIREEIGKEEDRIPMQMREALQQRWNVNLPEDARFSQVRELMPAFSGAFRDQQSQEKLANEEERIDIARGNLEARKRGLSIGQQRADTSSRRADLSEIKVKRPSETNILSMADSAVMITNVEALLNDIDEGTRGHMSGPVLNEINNLLAYVGLDDPGAKKFQARLINSLMVYLNLISGKQMTKNERDLLALVVGNASMKGSTLSALLRAFLARFKATHASRLEALKGYDYDVSPLELDRLKDAAARAGGEDFIQGAGKNIRVFNEKTGEYGEIDAGQRDKLESLPWIKIVE